jgi:hypothetical protein
MLNNYLFIYCDRSTSIYTSSIRDRRPAPNDPWEDNQYNRQNQHGDNHHLEGSANQHRIEHLHPIKQDMDIFHEIELPASAGYANQNEGE